MNRSQSKIRHIQEANRILELRYNKNELIEEQFKDNVVSLVKNIISFIWSMSIVPGPIDGIKLIYNIYKTNDPIGVIKNFVRSKITSPGENWEKIENDLNRLGNDASNFKDILIKELKSKLGV